MLGRSGWRDAGLVVKRGLDQQCGFVLKDAGVVVSGGVLGGGVRGLFPPCILTDVHSLAPHNAPHHGLTPRSVTHPFLCQALRRIPKR